MIRMKKFLIFLFILFIFLSVSNVSGGLFGPDTLECNYFSIEIPEGYYVPESWGYYDQKQDCVYLNTKSDDNPIKTLRVYGESYGENRTYDVVENFTVDNILFEKCTNCDLGNCIRAEFDKENHHYIVYLRFNQGIDNFNMKDYVDLIKTVRDTLKPK